MYPMQVVLFVFRLYIFINYDIFFREDILEGNEKLGFWKNILSLHIIFVCLIGGVAGAATVEQRQAGVGDIFFNAHNERSMYILQK